MLWDNFIHFFYHLKLKSWLFLSINFDAKRCFLILYSFFLAMCLINTTPDFGLQFLFWMLKPLYTCSLVTKFRFIHVQRLLTEAFNIEPIYSFFFAVYSFCFFSSNFRFAFFLLIFAFTVPCMSCVFCFPLICLKLALGMELL